MSDKKRYVEFRPGDLITAEGMNEMQSHIKTDLGQQVKNVSDKLDAYIAKPVDAATFDKKNPDQWIADFDDRYVKINDLKQKLGDYRRYFKQVPANINPIVIEHKMHRYPLVEVSVLQALNDPNDPNKKFRVYYAGNRDPVAQNFTTRANDIYYWGDPLNLILEQIGLPVADSQIFDDVLNDMWGKMFIPGQREDFFDFDKYGHSEYIQNQVLVPGLTVHDLKQNGQWKDLRLAVRPKVLNIGLEPASVQVTYISQDAIEIKLPTNTDNNIENPDLMVLLRT